MHALATDPGSGALLIASHSGLYRADARGIQQVGPAIDLMGFTVTGPGRYLASGHPQPGTDLPQPVGLIESRDEGRTWQVLSRGGESDFHVLAATRRGLVAFDGAWRTSPDLLEWTPSSASFAPISLIGSERDDRVLASDGRSLWASDDGGRSWQSMPEAPGPALLARAGEAVVAVTADGAMHLGRAAGTQWTPSGARAPGPVAVTAWGPVEDLTVVVLAEAGLVVSRDGRAFEPWVADGTA
ncbi:conserved hypothetical protein [Nostocoides japonicum T1-X7]|uniref:Exo-alpha-sialidase n=1 Tax=Nostocoides japonicum T1-X7 TaxID=1194083 RepID=A0A077LY60_9MICO|nr:exo-alpha-sialidase [Tetrasphaera japonica]CCH76875.1 conserved hypothetical protein [Tetrasphaera japonica T1-X7]